MSAYVFRALLTPEATDSWRDMLIEDKHSLEDLHVVLCNIEQKTDEWLYRFDLVSDDGKVDVSYFSPSLYNQYKNGVYDSPKKISNDFIQAISKSDIQEETIQSIVDKQPDYQNAADMQLEDLDLESGDELYYITEYGGIHEFLIQVKEVEQETLAGPPEILNTQGEFPL